MSTRIRRRRETNRRVLMAASSFVRSFVGDAKRYKNSVPDPPTSESIISLARRRRRRGFMATGAGRERERDGDAVRTPCRKSKFGPKSI